jgi:hypothetical protein
MADHGCAVIEFENVISGFDGARLGLLDFWRRGNGLGLGDGFFVSTAGEKKGEKEAC